LIHLHRRLTLLLLLGIAGLGISLLVWILLCLIGHPLLHAGLAVLLLLLLRISWRWLLTLSPSALLLLGLRAKQTIEPIHESHRSLPRN
jgi:hypothetical protein